jgi:hypothetical protein
MYLYLYLYLYITDGLCWPLVLGVSVAVFMTAYVRRTNHFCVLLPAQASFSSLACVPLRLRLLAPPSSQQQHQHQRWYQMLELQLMCV